ncbi:MAG: NUDIX domain-containing protein [Burkholderiales bacterium]|nr:NUDIX domain-containing protein [Burkholderiales bacterium]
MSQSEPPTKAPAAVAPAWLLHARSAAALPPPASRVPLRYGGAGPVIGSIEPALAERARAAGLPFVPGSEGWAVADPGDAALAAIARWLHEEGVASRWRDELLPVVDAEDGSLAAIERSVVRVLGLKTFAVHLAGRSADGGFWVQQRAFDKATDPGRWDTLMGGQRAAGESIEETLRRESWEEAGLVPDELAGLGRAADVIVRRPVAEGYMDERIVVFRAALPAGVQPVNRDGEVVAFECLREAALRERLAAGAFTLEATLILGAELERLAAERR